MDDSVEIFPLGGQRPVHCRHCFTGIGRLSQVVGPASGLEHTQGDGSNGQGGRRREQSLRDCGSEVG